MAGIPMVHYWRGRDIRSMSREDIESAFTELAKMWTDANNELHELQREAIWVMPPSMRSRPPPPLPSVPFKKGT